eukprot:6206971-Pleurochrysis_carterae.AAC.1
MISRLSSVRYSTAARADSCLTNLERLGARLTSLGPSWHACAVCISEQTVLALVLIRCILQSLSVRRVRALLCAGVCRVVQRGLPPKPASAIPRGR